jgi:ribosomal protein S18 acetylase RimI-like enzyme
MNDLAIKRTEISIKRAEINDLQQIATLFDCYRQFYQQESDIDLATIFIRDRINQDQSIIFIALSTDDEAIGFCQLYPTFCSVIAAPIYVLYDLFVLPSARRTGAGKLLLLAAEEHAKLNGIQRMDLTTAKSNTVAQSLYESLGWEQDVIFFTYTKTIDN